MANLPLRLPAVPTGPISSADSLASLASTLHAPDRLYVGGAMQRAARLVEKGYSPEVAALIAAVQGKGAIGELTQAASYSSRSGALGRPTLATLSRSPANPVADVNLYRHRRIRKRAQVKVGGPKYVLRAARTKRYEHIVANAEAKTALADDGFEEAFALADHLHLDAHRSETLTAANAHRRAVVAIERELSGALPVGVLDVLSEMARSGARDGVVTFALSLTLGVIERVWTGARVEVPTLAREAFSAAARGSVRAAIQTGALATKFVMEARSKFAAKLLHRVAKASHVIGAIAEVAVETGLDLLAVLRKQLSFEDLLRRVGVHTFTAAGGATGAWLGAELTSGMPWLVQLLAMGVAGWAGSRLGRAAGTALFMPEDAQPMHLPARQPCP